MAFPMNEGALEGRGLWEIHEEEAAMHGKPALARAVTEGDARLIAAAPSLLAALKRLVASQMIDHPDGLDLACEAIRKVEDT